jgi:hypothetical protein
MVSKFAGGVKKSRACNKQSYGQNNLPYHFQPPSHVPIMSTAERIPKIPAPVANPLNTLDVSDGDLPASFNKEMISSSRPKSAFSFMQFPPCCITLRPAI